MRFSGNVNLKEFARKTILFLNCFEGARTSGGFEGVARPKYLGPQNRPNLL